MILPSTVDVRMADLASEVPHDVLDDVAYLARSPNRVRLLATLASGAYTRGDLADRTAVASTTVSRIVNEFEERDWVERTEAGAYTVTPVGRQVVAEFTPFLESMSVLRTIGEAVAWLQAAEEPLDLRQLADATVLRPDPADPMAPMNAYMADLRSASEFRFLVGVAPPESFERAMRNGVVERGVAVEHVITRTEFEYLRDYPERLARWRGYVEAGANVYCVEGPVPCNLLIFDETVYIANTQSEYGEPYTVIRSDRGAVLDWARGLIEGYREVAERLGPDAFAANGSASA